VGKHSGSVMVVSSTEELPGLIFGFACRWCQWILSWNLRNQQTSGTLLHTIQVFRFVVVIGLKDFERSKILISCKTSVV